MAKQTESSSSHYPIDSFSWTIISDELAAKRMDKSSFPHHGTGIPSETSSFFCLPDIPLRGKKPVTLRHKGVAYAAHFYRDPFDRVRLLWKQDFADTLKATFPDWFEAFSRGEEPSETPPLMTFERLDEEGASFHIELKAAVTTGFDNEGTTLKKRNPPWARDELILALDSYFRHNPSHVSQDHPEVIALSALLNALPIHKVRPDEEGFRNKNGVYMKLCNFLRLDSEYHGAGLTRGGKMEALIWGEFTDRPGLPPSDCGGDKGIHDDPRSRRPIYSLRG